MKYSKIYFWESVICVLSTLVYLKLQYDMQLFDLKIFSLADAYLHQMQPMAYTLLVVPFLIIAVAVSMKDDFYSTKILFYRSKWDILKEQIKRAMILSVYFAILYMVVTIIFGIAKNQVIYNWDKNESYFFINNYCKFQGLFWEVMLMYLFISILRNFLIATIIVLSKWYFKHIAIGFLITMGICITEAKQTMLLPIQIKILLRIFFPTYEFWVSQTMRIKIVGIAILYAGILFFAAKVLVKKKEFLNEKMF